MTKLPDHQMTKSLNWELVQEPQVVFIEQPDVLHLIPQDRHPFDADAPCEPGVLLRVVSDRFEDRRMHHAASAQPDPAGPLAHRAVSAFALPAAQGLPGAPLG